MHNIDRMNRQIAMIEALEVSLKEKGREMSPDSLAILVLAARLEEFCEDFTENIHRAGEGI